MWVSDFRANADLSVFPDDQKTLKALNHMEKSEIRTSISQSERIGNPSSDSVANELAIRSLLFRGQMLSRACHVTRNENVLDIEAGRTYSSRWKLVLGAGGYKESVAKGARKPSLV
jgi:hypothetical protein